MVSLRRSRASDRTSSVTSSVVIAPFGTTTILSAAAEGTRSMWKRRTISLTAITASAHVNRAAVARHCGRA